MITLFNKFLQQTKRCEISPGEQEALREAGQALVLILSDDDTYEGWNQLAVIAQNQVKRITEEADLAAFDENFGD